MKVAVIGAGYAGMVAANRVAKKIKGAEITVINPRPDFVERVRLHQQIAATKQVATPLREILPGRVRTLVTTVDTIGDGVVRLAGGESAGFDFAFLAVGSTVRPLPGTLAVGEWESAERARTVLAAMPADGVVTVIGGGPTGIETASEIAAARPDLDVRLVGTAVAETFTGRARQRILDGLERLGVAIVNDGVAAAEPGSVRLRSGQEERSDLTLWAIVSGVPDLAARSGLAVDDSGRVIVDDFLRSVTDPRIFAVGDCAAVPGSRFACQCSVPQGGHAADNLARIVAGKSPARFSMRFVGRGVSLGRKDAVVQLTRRDDTLRDGYLAAKVAVAAKEAATRGASFGARTGFGGSW
ncbi:NAD(P)/FAD-dependent oxidoreductase [Phytomonospora endophytica]|uniref:NADH dehydrogenase FAD-containing subunit n=1 Tax=Phytomonospora endophytica TaxID=714109 RepID=A0A841FX50_9ACTN|nr:FAD-dependent oxidoreductase [Phytomonospora endophytica]MBB6037927.1 NADH dehydrogenase FAD-containing subunit [Phytomonospora endophytica]GIG68827.1 dehydrogenase [Phytomonospora endophytica]